MLILASASPRRREILDGAGIPHVVRPTNIPEIRSPGEPGPAFVKRMAVEKAQAVQLPATDIVLAADTAVLLDDEVLGKPVDDEDAIDMLSLLSGRVHQVVTGICLRHAEGQIAEVHTTAVEFLKLTADEIADYTQSGEGRDKAGAYAIQGRGGCYVRRIEGCYYNVVGLPLSAVYRHLASFAICCNVAI